MFRYHPTMRRQAKGDFSYLLSLITGKRRSVNPNGSVEDVDRPVLEPRLQSLNGNKALVPRPEEVTDIHFRALSKFWA